MTSSNNHSRTEQSCTVPPAAHADPPSPSARTQPGLAAPTSATARPRPRRRAQCVAGRSLETAEAAFRMLTVGPAPLALDGIALGCGLPARHITLMELRAMLAHPATRRSARVAAWRQIITNVQAGGPAWVVGAVGLALPDLRRLATDLTEDRDGTAVDVQPAVVTGFVAALHRVEVDQPGVIPRLRWGAYRAALLTRHHRHGVTAVPLPPVFSARPGRHPAPVLADAVAKGVLPPLAAELIARSRIDGVSLTSAARELSVDTQTASKALGRGEAQLAAALARDEAGDRPPDLDPVDPFRTESFHVRPVRRRSRPEPPPLTPEPGDGPERVVGREPAGVRGSSAESDGTSDADTANDTTDEKGVFCGPAHQPPQPRQARPCRRFRKGVS